MPPREEQCPMHSGFEARLDEGEKVMDRLELKIDRMNWWVVVTLGGVSASLILLVLNLVSKKGV